MLAKKCLLVGIFILFSLSLAISAQPVHPTTGEPLVIDCLRGTVTIDGDLSDWNLEAMTPATLDAVEQLSSGQDIWENVGDCGGAFYMLWDDENIYIAAVVTDDKLSMNKTDASIWNSDCIEVLFSTTDAVADHSWANPTIHYQYGFNANNQIWNWCSMEVGGQIVPDYLQAASSITADGYICEVSIKHSEITPLDFSAGSIIGFLPCIDDTDIDDGDTEFQMSWTGLPAHDQSFGFGHMVLSADSVPEPVEKTVLFAEDFEGLALGPNVDEALAGDAVWTDTPPEGWSVDESGIPGLGMDETDGVTEWAGWAFADKAWWIEAAEDQDRSLFELGSGTVAVADPDEWDDDERLPIPIAVDPYDTWLTTPEIKISSAEAGTLELKFDSSWRPEFDDNLHQTANITASFDGGEPVVVMLWESDEASDYYKPYATNETVIVKLDNPEGAKKLVLTFGLFDAGNDWWWAIDNVEVSGVVLSLDPVNPGTDGLVASYALDGDATDSSGNGNDGTITNADTGGLGDGGSVWVDDPERGTVISFNGTAEGAYVHAGDIPQMTLANDFTWSFWAKHSDENTADNDIILGNRYDPNGVDFVPRQFIKFTPTKFEWHMNGNGDDNLDYDDIPADVWLHHVVVKNADQLTYYRNGAEASSGTFIQPLDFPQPLYFGGDNTGAEGENWSGLMSDVGIYDRALSEAEVMYLAGLRATPVDPGADNLVHSWTFDDDTADDVVGDAEGVLIGDAVVVDGQLVLDGDGDWMDMPGDVIAMNTFEGLTIEIMFTSVAGGNTGYHMVTAFGEEGTGDNPGYGYKYVCITPARGNDVSRGMIQTVSMDNDPWSEETGVSDVIEHDDGLEHHMVCTVDDTELAFYVDGVLIGTAALDPPGNSIAGLGTDVAHIGKGVYNVDPLWAGSVDYVNLYNRALSLGEIRYLAGARAMDDFLGPDVTAPGDVVQGVPNDGLMDGDDFGWPGAETPDLAIDDDIGTKFLHFKGDIEPTGIRVEPASGPSIVSGLTLTTANDSPARDPATFELSGSNDSIDGPYTLIASGDVVDFTQEAEWPRFTMNATPITFDNDVAYTYYQLMFPTVRDAAGDNSMQIAEVELRVAKIPGSN